MIRRSRLLIAGLSIFVSSFLLFLLSTESEPVEAEEDPFLDTTGAIILEPRLADCRQRKGFKAPTTIFYLSDLERADERLRARDSWAALARTKGLAVVFAIPAPSPSHSPAISLGLESEDELFGDILLVNGSDPIASLFGGIEKVRVRRRHDCPGEQSWSLLVRSALPDPSQLLKLNYLSSFFSESQGKLHCNLMARGQCRIEGLLIPPTLDLPLESLRLSLESNVPYWDVSDSDAAPANHLFCRPSVPPCPEQPILRFSSSS